MPLTIWVVKTCSCFQRLISVVLWSWRGFLTKMDCTGGCFTVLGKRLKSHFLRYNFCEKFDDGAVSLMRRRRLLNVISNTFYNADEDCCFHTPKYGAMRMHLGSSSGVVKHHLNIHMDETRRVPGNGELWLATSWEYKAAVSPWGVAVIFWTVFV